MIINQQNSHLTTNTCDLSTKIGELWGFGNKKLQFHQPTMGIWPTKIGIEHNRKIGNSSMVLE